ncbi:MAG: hypothetical protein M3209_13915 [Acidobacteriota bacterium]|nr:hypothetical protein [Acidobacteriota bacterium]
MKNVVFVFLLAFFVSPVFSQTKEAEKFDTLTTSLCCEALWTKLDFYLVELQKQPLSTGYLIFYEGKIGGCSGLPKKLPKRGAAENRARIIRNYLVKARGIDPLRLIIINGGGREEWTAELWIVRQGAKEPTPTPTIDSKDIKFKKGKLRVKDYEFPDCV